MKPGGEEESAGAVVAVVMSKLFTAAIQRLFKQMVTDLSSQSAVYLTGNAQRPQELAMLETV